MAQYVGIPVNTGAPGADTTDGTYAVFEHVRYSDMKGTNPDGSTYNDPNVPYASYFNGGDALHGFIRASYGSPQSNGCVEMSYADAALVWPLTPIGTLVTVEGPTTAPRPRRRRPRRRPRPPPTTTTRPARDDHDDRGSGGDHHDGGRRSPGRVRAAGLRQAFGRGRARLRRPRLLGALVRRGRGWRSGPRPRSLSATS